MTVTVPSLFVDALLSSDIHNWGYGDTTQAQEAHGHPAEDLVQVRAGHGLATREEPSGTGSVRTGDQAAARGDLTPRRPSGHGTGLDGPVCPERGRQPQFPDLDPPYRIRMCIRCGRITARLDADGIAWCGGDMPAEYGARESS